MRFVVQHQPSSDSYVLPAPAPRGPCAARFEVALSTPCLLRVQGMGMAEIHSPPKKKIISLHGKVEKEKKLNHQQTTGKDCTSKMGMWA